MPNLNISPPSALLTAGQAVTFAATNAAGQPTPVTWTLNPPIGGVVTAPAGTGVAPAAPAPSATYIAPPVIPAMQTIAIIAYTATDSASATISLTPDAISIVPSRVDLRASHKQQFMANVATGAEADQDITWILSPPTGTLDDKGLYTAPDDVHETTTLTVIAASRRLGKQAGATVNLASEPWRGMGANVLAIYLFFVFCVVFLMIGLWPLELPNLDSLRADLSQAEASLAQKMTALQVEVGASAQPSTPAGGAATKAAVAPTSPANTSRELASATILQQLQQAVDDARRDVNDKKAALATATDPSVHTRFFRTLNREIDLLWLVLLSGCLGSFLHIAPSFSDFTGNRTLKSSWVWWYCFRPFIGAALALVFYAALRGGLVTVAALPTVKASDLNPYGLVAAGALVGMFSKSATTKLGDVFETLFQSDKNKQVKDKLAPASQPAILPAKSGTDTGATATAK